MVRARTAPASSRELIPLDIDFTKPRRLTPLSKVRLDDYDYSKFTTTIQPPIKRFNDLEMEIIAEGEVIADRIDFTNPPNCAIDPDTIIDCIKGRGEANAVKRVVTAFQRVQSEPYNARLLQEAACLLQSFCRESGSDVKQIRKIIAEGKRGVVSSGAMRILKLPEKKEPLFILKSAKYTEFEPLNELLVALYRLNNLRDEIPNFAYIYAGFYAKPSSVTGKKINLFAARGERVLYTMVETIPGPTLSRWAAANYQDEKRIHQIQLQVLLALAIARERFSFSHGDLHSGNIIIRELEEPRTLRYRFNDGTEYNLVTDVIATIIDYGVSNARIPVKGLKVSDGPNRVEDGNFLAGNPHYEMGMNPKYSQSLYDVARFLSFLSYSLTRTMDAPGREFLDLLMSPSRSMSIARFHDWVAARYSVVPSHMDISPLAVVEAALPKLKSGVVIRKGALPKSFPPTFSCTDQPCSPSLGRRERLILPTKDAKASVESPKRRSAVIEKKLAAPKVKPRTRTAPAAV